MSQPEEAAPEEALRRPPREAWPLARVLSLVLMKMGHTGPPFEPRRRPQAGKSGDPRSQNADSIGCRGVLPSRRRGLYGEAILVAICGATASRILHRSAETAGGAA